MFCEELTRAVAINALFATCDQEPRDRGYMLMGGQIVDATSVAAPKRRNTEAENDAIKGGTSAAGTWWDTLAKAAQTPMPLYADVRRRLTTATRQAGDRYHLSQLRLYEQHRDLQALRLHPTWTRSPMALLRRSMLRDVVPYDHTAFNVWANTAYC